MGLELGTLSLRYAANTSGFSAGMQEVRRQVQSHSVEMRQLGQSMSGALSKSLDEARKAAERSAKDVKTLGEMMFGAFDGAAGAAAKAGERLSKLSSGVRDIFGDNATAMGQRWGREIQSAIGLSAAQLKGLEQAALGVSGALKVVAVVAGAISVPVLAVVGAIAGLVLLVETLKNGFVHGFGLAHAAVLLLLGPLGLMAAPILLVVDLVRRLKDVWAEVKQPVSEALRVVADKLGALWDMVRELAMGIGGAFADAATWMVQAMSSGVASLLSTAAQAFKWIEDNDPTGLAAKAGLSSKAAGAAQSVREAGQGFDGRAQLQSLVDSAGRLFELARAKLAAGADELKAGLRSIGSDIFSDGKDLAGKVKKFVDDFLKPGTTKEAAKKAIEDRLKLQGSFEESSRELWAYLEKAEQEELKEFLAHDAKMNALITERQKREIEAERERYGMAEKAIADAKKRLADEQQRAAERWNALGSGQLGTALGLKGIGGAALNIVGGAAAGQSQYLGGALSGAAQGGEAGGAWGAVIGAVLGLLVQSKQFKAVIEDLDVALEAIVTALGKMVEGVISDLFESLAGLTGLFEMIGSLLKVLTQFDLGMQAVTAIFKALGQIDFSGVTKAFDDAGKAVESWFNGEWAVGMMSEKGQKDYWANKEAAKRAQEEQRFQADLVKTRNEGLDGFNEALRQSRMDTILQGDAAYQAAAKSAFFAQNLVQLGQATIDATNMLELLNSAQGEQEYIESRLAALRLQKRQNELDEIVNQKAIEEGLAIQRVTRSLNEFNDAILNASTGYKFALTAYNAALGVGQAAYTGGGGGGGGGGTSSSSAPAGGGGGGGGSSLSDALAGARFGSNTVNVTIQSSDPDRIWAQLKGLMKRDNFVSGATPAARAPAFAGGI